MISRPGRRPAADGGPAADNNNSNRPMKRTLYILISLLSVCALAMPPQDDKTAAKRPAPKAQPKLVADDEPIPDSLLHPRWKIKKTAPVVVEDLDSSAIDLKMPDNIRQQVEYDDSLDMYLIGSKIGDTYLNAPVLMTPEEYRKWSERRIERLSLHFLYSSGVMSTGALR